MGGENTGILGLRRSSADDEGVRSIGDAPGPTGIDDPIPLDTPRIIASVDKDWDGLTPTPDFDTVSGTTLADVGQALGKLDEWGQGGGRVWNDGFPVGTSTNLTAHLHAAIVFRILSWDDYSSASAAAKAEWDRMSAKLRAHEERHVAIFLDGANQLAKDLIGKDISVMPRMVRAAGARIQQAQNQLDTQTDHGRRKGVPFGDVFLDTSIP